MGEYGTSECAYGRTYSVRTYSLWHRSGMRVLMGEVMRNHEHAPVVAVWQELVVEGAPRRIRGRARPDEDMHPKTHITHTRPPRERGR